MEIKRVFKFKTIPSVDELCVFCSQPLSERDVIYFERGSGHIYLMYDTDYVGVYTTWEIYTRGDECFLEYNGLESGFIRTVPFPAVFTERSGKVCIGKGQWHVVEEVVK